MNSRVDRDTEYLYSFWQTVVSLMISPGITGSYTRHRWTTATACYSVDPTHVIDGLLQLPASLQSQLHLFTSVDDPTTSQTLWSAFTVDMFNSGSSLSWHIELFTALRHLTWCCQCDNHITCQHGVDWPAHSAKIPFVYSRRKSVSGCRRPYVEWFAGGYDLCAITYVL